MRRLKYARTAASGEGVKARAVAVGRHVAGELVVVPEQPAQDLEPLRLVGAAELPVALRQPQQDRRRLRQALRPVLEDRNLAHRVDRRPPLRRARDAAAEVGPDRLEGLAAQGEHEGELVAVPRFGEVVQAIAVHGRKVEDGRSTNQSILHLQP